MSTTKGVGYIFPTGLDHICFDFSYSDEIYIYNESIVDIVNDELKMISFEDHFKTEGFCRDH